MKFQTFKEYIWISFIIIFNSIHHMNFCDFMKIFTTFSAPDVPKIWNIKCTIIHILGYPHGFLLSFGFCHIFPNAPNFWGSASKPIRFRTVNVLTCIPSFTQIGWCVQEISWDIPLMPNRGLDRQMPKYQIKTENLIGSLNNVDVEWLFMY